MTYQKMYESWLRGIIVLIRVAILSYIVVFASMIWTFRTSEIAFLLIAIMGGFIIYCDHKMPQIKRWISKNVSKSIIEKYCNDANYLCVHDIIMESGEGEELEYEWIDHVIITKKAIFVVETKFNNADQVVGKPSEKKWSFITKKLNGKTKKTRGANSFILNDKHIEAIKKLIGMPNIQFVNYVSYLDWVDFKCATLVEKHKKYVEASNIADTIERDLKNIDSERMDTVTMSKICIKLHEADIKDKEIRKLCIKMFDDLSKVGKFDSEFSKNQVIYTKEDEIEEDKNI